MRATFKISLMCLAYFMTSAVSRAQPILIGITGNLTTTSPTTKLFEIDQLTGLASNPRDTGIFLIGGISTQPSTGNLFGLTTFVSSPANSLIKINPITGVPTTVGPTGLQLVVEGDLAFNPLNGLLYGIQDAGSTGLVRNLFQINPDSGTATTIGSMNTQGDYSALAFNSAGTLFTIDDGVTGNSLLHTIDPNTGQITDSKTMNVDLGGGVGLTFDPITGTAYVGDGGQTGTGLFYSLNVSTGFLTPIGPTGIPGGIVGLSFVTVPEPSSFVLIGLAFVTYSVRRHFLPFATNRDTEAA